MNTSTAEPAAPDPWAAALELPVSPGEFLDRLGILELKAERIPGPVRQQRIRRELRRLHESWNRSRYAGIDLDRHYQALKTINGRLWAVEDRIREKEADQCFDREFIELARSVYLLNDQRARLKQSINDLLGSSLGEEKSYPGYEVPEAPAWPFEDASEPKRRRAQSG